MKIEKITPQIAALYYGQPCTITWLVEDASFERGEQWVASFRKSVFEWMEFGKCSVVPHLRRLESLTEEEARELYEIRYGESWEKGFLDIKIDVTQCLENFWNEDIEVYIEEGKLLIGSPSVWLKLLEWGFDLFGLIDSGLAKEVEPKKD